MTRTLGVRIGLISALLGGLAWASTHRELFTEAALQEQIVALGPWAPAVFVLVYALSTPLFLPGSALTAAGGAAFGPVAGTAWSLLGATLGATISFLLARTVAGDVVRRRAGPRAETLLRGVEQEGWRFVALVRLVPLFPFNLSNYAFGLTRIRLLPYALTSAMCMLPGAAAFAFAGHGGRAALGGDSGALGWGLAALGLLAAVALLPRLVRRLRPRPARLSMGDLGPLRDATPDMVLLDVRSLEEFDGPLGHIPGSRCIPLGELEARADELDAARSAPLVVVCRTDRRSARAAQLLAALGFDRLLILDGGVEAWNRASIAGR